MKSIYLSLLVGLCLLLGSTPAWSTNERSDNIPPVAICTDQLNVSLTSSGTAIVLAQSFDEGSYDNYCLAAIKVKKTYDPYDDFGPWVEFDCYDIGQLVSVELKVIDCAGNTNSCWVDVWVEDKIGPGIWCPYDKTVACENLYDWNILGQATASDACGVASITHQDIDNLGSCGTGYITRVWKATDLYGNMSSCTQTIHVIDNTPVVVYFPPDYVSYDCVSEDDLLPENLPAPFNGPQVLYEDCEIIATSYEDWVFTAAPNSCIKIIRNWKVIDWCSYQYGSNQGYWEGTQILKIQDTIPPTATCPTDFTVSTGYGDCLADVTLPLPTDIQDCLANVEVSIHGDLGPGTIHSDLPIGEYEVGYLLEDGCNNKSTCHITVSVVDGQPPGPVCLNGVSLSLMANGMIELSASHVEQGSSLDACTDYSHLQFRLGLEPQAGQTTPPDDDFLVFDCDDVGTNVIALWAGDAAGNWAYCLTYAEVQDNQGICPGVNPADSDSTVSIAGFIADEWGNRIQAADVYIDSTSYWSFTDSAGEYTFNSMPMVNDYIIEPQKSSDPLEGLSLSDIIILAKHLMGVDTLDTPYQYIAADVDRSGSITQDDMMKLHIMLLGLENPFPDSLSWRFIPESFVWPDIYPLAVNFPETITLNDLDEDITDADFIGVKIGDLDGSASSTADDISGLENRNQLSDGLITLSDHKLVAGDILDLPVYLNSEKEAAGIQLLLKLEGIEIVDVIPTHSNDLLGIQQHKGNLIINWIPERAQNQAAIFTLKVKVNKAGTLSQSLKLDNSSRLGIELGGFYEEAGLKLEFLAGSSTFNLHTVFPNPFKASTSFTFEQANAGKTMLTIWNAQGQVVYQKEQHFNTGSQRWEVLARELGTNGTFIYQLSNGADKISGQILMMGE